MATEYSFKLNGADTEQVSHLVKHAVTAADLVDKAAENSGNSGNILASGLLVGVTTRSPLPFPDPVEEELGFAPTVNVVFRFNTAADVQQQRRDMVSLVSTLLTGTPGDAVLMFAGEVVWLLRKGGQLTISNRDDFWTPDIVELLPRPYERASLPVL